MQDNNKDKAKQLFLNIRDQICLEVEKIESGAKFEKKRWQRPGGGGGEISVLKGKVFEKIGVNISTVYGEFSNEMAKEISGAQNNPKFWASGVSLVAHMCSPLVPAVHMNVRHIITEKSWFGGGADLTPMYPDEKDTKYFHQILKKYCDKHDKNYYQKFKDYADEYFYLHHRKEPRGIGGIFFDNLNSGDWQKDYNFVADVGQAFLESYLPIVKQKMQLPWTKEQREYQLRKRGRYVEFNLLFDRGTKFGVMTNGNPEAYMMSMPPSVKWD